MPRRHQSAVDLPIERFVRWTLAHKGRFADRVTGKVPGLMHKWHLFVDGHIIPRRDPNARLLQAAPSHPIPPAPAHGFRMTWIGHATFVLQAAGKTVLVDPVWSDMLPGRIRRLVPAGITWEHLPRIDAVLVSHNHYDHLDAPTLRRLPRTTTILCPLGLGRWFRRRGFTEVRELDWHDESRLGGLGIHLVPVNHWSRRGLFDTNDTLWGGYVLSEPGGERLFFGGDSGYGASFAAVGKKYPGITTALLGIGAYSPRWYNQAGHTTPEEAIQAMADLGATQLVPMHWGTFRLSPEPVWEPVERVMAAWKATGRSLDGLWLLRHGESRETKKGREAPLMQLPFEAHGSVQRIPLAASEAVPAGA